VLDAGEIDIDASASDNDATNVTGPHPPSPTQRMQVDLSGFLT
jgi:hypothetical protein